MKHSRFDELDCILRETEFRILQLEACIERINELEKINDAYFVTACNSFQSDLSNLVIDLNGHRSKTIANISEACTEAMKGLDASLDTMEVAVGQLSASAMIAAEAFENNNLENLVLILNKPPSFQFGCHGHQLPVRLHIESVAEVLAKRLNDFIQLQCYEIDTKTSIASGAGLVVLQKSDEKLNYIRVICKDLCGNLAAWVTSDDVSVFIHKMDGTVAVAAKIKVEIITAGIVIIHYAINCSDIDAVDIVIFVGGAMVFGSPFRVTCVPPVNVIANSRFQQNFHLTKVIANTFVVTNTGEQLVVLQDQNPEILIYCASTGTCVSKFTCSCGEDGQVFRPLAVCSTPRGTILVLQAVVTTDPVHILDHSARVIQELQLTGEHVRFLGANTLYDCASCLCMYHDVVAVARHSGRIADDDGGRIVLVNYLDGTCMRMFGPYGWDEGQVRGATSISFTTDGLHILVVEQGYIASMFDVGGKFVRSIGLGVIGPPCRLNGVLCSGSNIFITDSYFNRILVFSAETGDLLRIWEGDFYLPSCLAAFQNKLFVLDLKVFSNIQLFI